MVSPIWIWWVRLPRQISAYYQAIFTISVVILSLVFYRWHRRGPSSGVVQRSPPTESSTAKTSSSWISSLRDDREAICCITFDLLEREEQQWIVELARSCRLIVIARDTVAKHSWDVVKQLGLDQLVPGHRLLLCQTTSGVYSIVRQIDPRLFIAGEDDLEALRRLEPFLAGSILISPHDRSHIWGGTIRSTLKEALCSLVK